MKLLVTSCALYGHVHGVIKHLKKLRTYRANNIPIAFIFPAGHPELHFLVHDIYIHIYDI